jgi:signal transduction histidine kinase/Na+/proline symporter
MISQSTLFFVGLSYLGILFLIAYITERGLVPKKIIEHPLVFILSLGVFAGSWTIYGALGFAHESGYNYLTFYLGLSAAYFLAPVLLTPLFRLSKNYQLNSLADVLAFRYRSPFLGKIVTIFMLIAITPLLSAQIQSVASAIQYITKDSSKDQLAIVFCIFMIVFTIVFGAQHFGDKDKKHDGLVLAMAAESLFKLIAMLIIAGFCIFIVFDGFDGMNTWLRNNPKNVSEMFQPMVNGNWQTLLLIFFAASFAMPHMFHMAFTENNKQQSLYKAAWGLPLYLLLLAICIPPILWAGKKVFNNDQVTFDYVAIGLSIASDSPLIGLLAYLSGISAASGIIIVSTLALASMCLNHLIIPRGHAPSSGVYLYSWLRWQRYFLIALIITSSYLVYKVIDNQQTLSQLILLAYTASVQFLPAMFGVLFWKGANRQGVLLGLFAGFGIWLISFYLPLLIELDPLGLFRLLGIDISYIGIELNNRDWHFITMSSVIINFGIMIFGSMITPTREDEVLAAEQCNQDLLSRQHYRQLAIDNAYEFKVRLSKPLGDEVAEQEVSAAMNELSINNNESRPFILQKLRNRIETNLSRLLGPSRAQEILSEHIPITGTASETEDISSMEGRLEEYQYRLTGLAAELNNLRKFHRQTLIDMPIGVCALAQDHEIVTWNNAIEAITSLKSHDVIGANLQNIPSPWGALFKEFILSTDTHWHRKKITINEETRWLNLHKASISENSSTPNSSKNEANSQSLQSAGLALLVEDTSNIMKLEAKLTHSERLASIGRMAAGVAHEIGNPVTGIDCLAQNLLYDIKSSENGALPDDGKEMLDEIRLQAKRITNIVQSLMSFSRAGKTDRENVPVNIYDCIEEAKKLLQLGSYERNIEINNQSLPSHFVLGDEQLLTQVFINLISNAIDASKNNTSILVRSQPAASKILISVIDQGEGIAESLIPSIFEPFVTTKDPGKGTGLGLALVHSIVEDHAGSINIENWSQVDGASHRKSSGTQVNIKIPAYKQNQ